MYKTAQISSMRLFLAAVSTVALWAQQAQFEYKTFGPLEAKTVTGAPYSATAITTFTQTLADGTHITRTIQAQLARDSEGRTRREETLSAIGPWPAGKGEQHIVTINDPVAQTRYMIRPDQEVAVKSSSKMDVIGALIDTKMRKVVDESTREKINTAVESFVYAAKDATLMVKPQMDKSAQVQDLGERVIEGVTAHGRQEKRTFAIGEIGNDRPIEVSSETWYSSELQTVVLSKRSDPRVGDNEYRLTNISRTEPSRSLFEVPAGYVTKETGKRRE